MPGYAVFGARSAAPETPWVVHEPEKVPLLHARLSRAWDGVRAQWPRDEMFDWWEEQHGAAEEVLSYASARGEWVVGVFEGDVACFLRGGMPTHLPTQDLFEPTCKVPRAGGAPGIARAFGWAGPLGALGALLAVSLGLARWRQRRLRARRAAGSRPAA